MALTKEQIKEFKEREKEAEDSYDYRSVADDIAEAGDKDWAKKVYEKAEKKSEDCSDFTILADNIIEKLGDKEWAKTFYEKAEDKAEDNDDIRALAKDVYKNLGDQNWSNILYKKAPLTKEEIKEFKAAEKEAEDSSDFRGIADDIAEAGDKEWAKKVYEKAEKKAEDFTQLNDIAYGIVENLTNKEWAKKVYEKAEKKAQDSGEFCDLAEFIQDNLGDNDWAIKLYKKAEKKAEDCTEMVSLADTIFEKLNDKEWAKKIDMKAAGKAEGYYDFLCLGDSAYKTLDDKVWAKKNYLKAEKFTENSYELNSLAESIRDNLGDIKWSKSLEKRAEDLEKETTHSIRIYIKTEPAGEICAGKLSDNEVSKLRELFIKDSLKDSELVEYASEIDNIGHTYGVFTSKDGSDVEGMEFDVDNYNVHSTIEIPNNDGFYVVYTGLSKISAEFHFSPEDGEVFDSSQIKFNVTDVKLDMVSDGLYGELEYSVIDGYLYNGKEIEEASEDIYVDRGIDREVTIIFVKNNEQYVIYNIRNESEEKYCAKQLKNLAASLEKTGDKEWAKSLEKKAKELEDENEDDD